MGNPPSNAMNHPQVISEQQPQPISTLNLIHQTNFQSNATEEVKNQGANTHKVEMVARNYQSSSIGMSNHGVTGTNLQQNEELAGRSNQTSNSIQNNQNFALDPNQRQIMHKMSSTQHAAVHRLNSKNQEEEKKEAQSLGDRRQDSKKLSGMRREGQSNEHSVSEQRQIVLINNQLLSQMQ